MNPDITNSPKYKWACRSPQHEIQKQLIIQMFNPSRSIVNNNESVCLPGTPIAIAKIYLPSWSMRMCSKSSSRYRPAPRSYRAVPTMPNNWAQQIRHWCRRMRSPQFVDSMQWPDPRAVQSNCRSKIQSPTTSISVYRNSSDSLASYWVQWPVRPIPMRWECRLANSWASGIVHQKRPRLSWLLGRHRRELNDAGLLAHCK